MKKVILSLMTFAFALLIGVGASVMFPQKAAADLCVDVPGVIYVNTGQVCWLSHYVEGVLIRVYDGMTEGSELPCLYIKDVCWLDRTHEPANNVLK